jgi:hypothetical protein
VSTLAARLLRLCGDARHRPSARELEVLCSGVFLGESGDPSVRLSVFADALTALAMLGVCPEAQCWESVEDAVTQGGQ